MKTTVVNSDTRPDLFFLPVDKLDGEGKPIPILDDEGRDTGEVEKEYTLKAEVDKESFADYDLVKRKSAKGIAEIRNYSDKSEIWHEVDGHKYKLAEQAVYLEYSSDGEKWTRSKADSFKIDEISLDAADDIARVDIDSETGKQTFTVAKKSYQVRCVWEITRFQAYDDCFDDLRLDYSDYKGNVSDSDWIDNVRTIIFEEKGVKDKLVVDPYLGVDEETNYYLISCDGFKVRINYSADTGNEIGEIYFNNNTYGFDIENMNRIDSPYYYFGEDTDRTGVICVNTNTFVAIEVSGQLKQTDGTALAGSFKQRWYCYPDRFIISTIWETESSLNFRDNSVNAMVRLDLGNSAWATNEDILYQNGTDESAPTTGTNYSSSDYLVFISDEINIQMIALNYTDTSDFIQREITADDTMGIGWNNNSSFPSGTHKLDVMFVVDTPDREHGSQLYSKSDRLAIGNEFTNISTDLTSGNAGDPVTDRNVPATINTTSGFCADGAFHVKSDSNNAGKFTMDRARALFAFVLEEWEHKSGDPSSPTEYLTAHFKLDAAGGTSSAQLYDEVAGSWVGGGADTVTFDDGVKGNCLVADSTSDRAYIPGSYIYTDDKLTIEFDYLCTANDYDLYCFSYSSGGDSISFQPYVQSAQSAPLGRFGFRANYASNTAHVFFTTPEINVWHHVVLGIDVTNKKLYVFIDGERALDTEDHFSDIADQSSLSGSCYIGYLAAADGTMKVDNFKTYNDLILPYGTFIPANIINGDVDYDQAHSDITLYSNTSSLDIGTTSVTDISNISNSAGTIAFQVDPSSSLSADETLFSAGTNFKIEWINADNDIKFTYGTATVQTSTSLPSGLDGKHWIVARYEASDTISIEVDGLVDSTSASTAPTLGSAITWSSNVGMTKRTITSKQNTPQLWTANLIPLILPDFKSEVA